jgi:hypothetical protein
MIVLVMNIAGRSLVADLLARRSTSFGVPKIYRIPRDIELLRRDRSIPCGT